MFSCCVSVLHVMSSCFIVHVLKLIYVVCYPLRRVALLMLIRTWLGPSEALAGAAGLASQDPGPRLVWLGLKRCLTQIAELALGRGRAKPKLKRMSGRVVRGHQSALQSLPTTPSHSPFSIRYFCAFSSRYTMHPQIGLTCLMRPRRGCPTR